MKELTLNERVEQIKCSENDINQLVNEYKPFIASCVQKSTGHFVNYGEDDELSIALIAFVEAIKSYDKAKGNFLSFSQNVIKRRLIDYYRKEKKHSNVISITSYTNENDDPEYDFTANESMEKYSLQKISDYRKLELQDLKKELSDWDISFFDLVNISPKHEKTRRMYSDIIKFLVSCPELITQIKQKKLLPIAEIEKNLDIPRKTIERARKYILAVIIILTGDYQYVSEYIDLGVMK